jgi:hypothetical protein
MFYLLAATRKQKEFGIGSDCDRMAFTKSNENTNVILRVSTFFIIEGQYCGQKYNGRILLGARIVTTK